MIRALLLVLLAVAGGTARADATMPFVVSPAVLQAADATLSVPLPEGREIRFQLRSESPEPGLLGVRGRSAAGERLTLFLAPDRVTGDIYSPHGHYRLTALPEGGQGWARVPARPANIWQAPAGSPPLADIARLRSPAKAAAVAPRAEPDDAGIHQVDLLVLYTRLYEQRYGGRAGTRAEVQRLVFLANGYFETTAIPVRYRLVGIEKYTGIDEASDYFRMLAVVAAEPAVRAWRDRIGADLVGLLRTQDLSANLCGLSAGFNNFERSDPPENVVPERDGFMVAGMGASEDGQRCDDTVFAHELGHNLAAGHNSTAHLTALPGGLLTPVQPLYWKSYAHGYECGVAADGGNYASIMSYGTLASGLSARGDFFSSPRLLLDGMPCGAEGVPGSEATEADNARVITEAAPYVAAYRPTRIAAKAEAVPAGATPATAAGAPGSALLLMLGMAALGRRRRR